MLNDTTARSLSSFASDEDDDDNDNRLEALVEDLSPDEYEALGYFLDNLNKSIDDADDVEDEIDNFRDEFVGIVSDFEEWALDEFMSAEGLPDRLRPYLDEEFIAREMEHDYWTEEGSNYRTFIFRR